MASSKSKRLGTGRGQLRIIGGAWRGRKLSFTPAEGLRPSADRIRETLFNWLAPMIAGARCVDLFAGSGALGLEALSRGAQYCDFVDSSKGAANDITDHLDKLDARDRGVAHLMRADQYLMRASSPPDVVFLDPPFGLNLVEPSAAQLTGTGLLMPGALIYIESPAEEHHQLPPGWVEYRRKQAGGVAYGLWEVGAE